MTRAFDEVLPDYRQQLGHLDRLLLAQPALFSERCSLFLEQRLHVGNPLFERAKSVLHVSILASTPYILQGAVDGSGGWLPSRCPITLPTP